MSRRRWQGPEWWAGKGAGERVGVVIAILVVAGGFISLMGFLAMSLWNAVMPSVFGVGTITYWQTWGLLLLSAILLKGFGKKKSKDDSPGRRRRHHGGTRHDREDVA